MTSTDNPYESPDSQAISAQDSAFDYFASTFRYWAMLSVIVFVATLIYALAQDVNGDESLRVPASIYLALVVGCTTLMLGIVLTYPIGAFRHWLAERKSQRGQSHDP